MCNLRIASGKFCDLSHSPIKKIETFIMQVKDIRREVFCWGQRVNFPSDRQTIP